MPAQEAYCADCGAPFIRYSSLRKYCDEHQRERALEAARRKQRSPITRSNKPLKVRKPLQRSTKRIKQYGKVQKNDALFREKVVRPYVEKKYGIACANCGAMPPKLDNFEYSRHALDHVRGKGPHPEDRFDVTNFQYLCVPCHDEKTGTVKWTPRVAA